MTSMNLMNNQELIGLMNELSIVFTPSNFENYRHNMSARDDLKPLISRAAEVFFNITDEDHHHRINLKEVANKVDQLSFLQCAQYMLFYFRLYFSQGGGETFTSLWINGSTQKILNKILVILK